ncbi:MAG: tRNA preQ1(34) S-adenosylmethionine ribosyltransferase-isomerase QueA [Leptospirales bacterium]|nr:tRNA preQ1(34) S-adenosylmethionine ribosyltransferase-isomerase QueA [Leptospirales bacterium]
MKNNYERSDFYFELPDELIAQYPPAKRGDSRILLLDRETGSVKHTIFPLIVNEIRQGDVLVFNDAKVIHGRVYCKRESGGLVEIVLAQRLDTLRWLIISNRTKRLKESEQLSALKDPSILFKIKSRQGEFLEVETNIPLEDDILDIAGVIPLPPYIKREAEEADKEMYQTVYATNSGSVAAPTAGLHFTPPLMERLKEKAQLEFITLYVSWGTFMPVRENNLELHGMHSEKYFFPQEVAERINKARQDGRRIIAVGTTSLRTLEATFKDEKNLPGRGETDIFIYPPYKFKSADALITNFHTPYSTLLMLISAFAGYDLTMKTYKEAVREKYRFFSYGDAMFIT